jgi:hypothetical protein
MQLNTTQATDTQPVYSLYLTKEFQLQRKKKSLKVQPMQLNHATYIESIFENI